MAEEKRAVPPYLPFKTFRTFIEGLAATGIPGRIERGVLPSYSGGMVSALLVTLRFFRLADDDGKPGPRLERLVSAEGDDRKKVLREYLQDSYTFIFNDSVNLSNATQTQVREAFEVVASGDTVRKCVAFFVAAAQDAGLTLSRFLKVPRARNGAPRKRQRAVAPRNGAAAAAPSKEIGTQDQRLPPTQAGTSRELKLKSGGTLTVSATIGLFSLIPTDREFMFELMTMLDKYEAKSTPAHE